MSELPDTSVCPRCGAGFRCGMVRRAGPPQASTAPSGGSALHEVFLESGVAKSVGADTLSGDAECWCVQLPHVMPVPAARAQPSADSTAAASCYCPACLKLITDERRQTPATAARD